jgi:hypothetical protein
MSNTPVHAGVRFPAVTIVAGPDVTAVVSNVLIPPSGTTARACPFELSISRADRLEIGDELREHLPAANPPRSPPPGLVRVRVSVLSNGPKGDCALETDLKVIDSSSGAGLLVLPNGLCLGRGACSTDL